MLPADFWLMCEGYRDYRNREHEFLRNVVFGAARYNAANTAFSKEAAKKISRQKFPWEKATKDDIISYDKVKSMFNMISKPEENGQ